MLDSSPSECYFMASDDPPLNEVAKSGKRYRWMKTVGLCLILSQSSATDIHFTCQTEKLIPNIL